MMVQSLPELWLKIRGDKGQGTFKLNLQLVNTSRPNSMRNTNVISVFKVGDSTTNLHTALGVQGTSRGSHRNATQVKYLLLLNTLLIFLSFYLYFLLYLGDIQSNCSSRITAKCGASGTCGLHVVYVNKK